MWSILDGISCVPEIEPEACGFPKLKLDPYASSATITGISSVPKNVTV
jgi:hypothetical protein